ncbi:MAG: sigma-54-dependent Fis family transcriptional regulator [Gammaproteobacteria bacterium]|nr:sigma-54-dependent Fis family transcriptional regulator [Gammaproteobacteria bacterium]
MHNRSVWLVDDNRERREVIRTILEFMEWSPIFLDTTSNWAQVLGYDGRPTFVVLGCDEATEVAGHVNALTAMLPGVPLLIMGDENTSAVAVESPHAYLSYPVKQAELMTSLDTLLADVDSAMPDVAFSALVGESAAIQQVRHLMGQVASSNASVLILGESGTGKEVVARSLHQHSARADKPFVPVNCGAIPAELLESELFGHEKGAFTGAVSARKGRFELAEGGTLFLDEIGDMSLNMQVKLLRVLQEKVFERVGGNKSIAADVRIIAATHRDLEQQIQQNQFREDLFYRLNVFPIDMPPLRQRSGDVALLAHEFVNRIEREGRGRISFTNAAMSVLSRYIWPGNVRELSNVIERLALMYPEQNIDIPQLPEKLLFNQSVVEMEALVEEPQSTASIQQLPGEGIDLKKHLSEVECSLIKQAMDESGGVVAHAAKRLHLRRTTLVEKLRKYGLNQRRDEVSVA